jgi:hypothetical protein
MLEEEAQINVALGSSSAAEPAQWYKLVEIKRLWELSGKPNESEIFWIGPQIRARSLA